MSTLPSSIHVGPHRFAVTDDETAYNRKTVEDGAKTWGFIEYGGLQIILEPHQAEAHKRTALLHEVLHAVEDLSDWEHPDTETFVRRIAAPLLDVLRRNPELVAYLIESDGEGSKR